MNTKLLFILLFCYSLSQAQITFEPGYFIDNQNKRTECFIENFDWRSNPTTFNYKLNENDREKKTGNIAGIAEFGITNASRYKRYTVDIERSRTTTINLQETKKPLFKKETLFLRTLITGAANLYGYTDGSIAKFFFEKDNTPIQQLVYIKYVNPDGNVYEYNQFRQQLLNNVKCDTQDDRYFSKMEYNQDALIKHFIAYNTCSGDKKVTDYGALTDGNREKIAIRILAGAYSGTASLQDPYSYYNKDTDLKKTILKPGLEFEYIMPFNKGSWSLFAEVFYEKFNPTKNFARPISNPGFFNDGDLVHYTAKMDYTSIQVPLGLRRYFFINKNARIFADAMYNIDVSNSGNLIITNSEGLLSANETIPFSNRNYLSCGLGFGYKAFSGEFRYNFSRKVNSDLDYNISYKSVGLNLGYKIF